MNKCRWEMNKEPLLATNPSPTMYNLYHRRR